MLYIYIYIYTLHLTLTTSGVQTPSHSKVRWWVDIYIYIYYIGLIYWIFDACYYILLTYLLTYYLSNPSSGPPHIVLPNYPEYDTYRSVQKAALESPPPPSDIR